MRFFVVFVVVVDCYYGSMLPTAVSDACATTRSSLWLTFMRAATRE
jgi:hypothetical protein